MTDDDDAHVPGLHHSRARSGVVGRWSVNVTVHGIGRPARPLDEDEDGIWISVEQFEGLLDAAVGRPDVTVTFDDGNLSDLEIGLPRLQERGLRGASSSRRGSWASRAGSMRRGCASCTAPEWSSGRTGGPTGTGGRWTGVRAAQRRSRRRSCVRGRVLGQLTGSEVSEVAVPFGSYDRHVLRRSGGPV